jgi:hypothetical protein
MNDVRPGPAAGAPLPPYRALLAVDIEKFSPNPSARLPDLSARLPAILRQAMERGGLQQVWLERRFDQSTGDGYLLGTEPEHLPFLVHPLLGNLQEVLAEHDRQLRALDRGLRLRLRVSLHVGPVPDTGDQWRDRVSTPTNDVFRLLDSGPVREALTASNPDVTLMAAIISQRVFEDVVLGGYTSLHPDSFEPVTAEIPSKNFAQPAWLYLARASRGPKPQADQPAGPDRIKDDPLDSPTPPPGREGQTNVFHGRVGQNMSMGNINGGVQIGSAPADRGQNEEKNS